MKSPTFYKEVDVRRESVSGVSTPSQYFEYLIKWWMLAVKDKSYPPGFMPVGISYKAVAVRNERDAFVSF